MPAVDKLSVQGFRSIGSLDLDLKRLNVVIGANGSGKSNLIGVFRFLDRIVTGNLQLYVAEHGGADRFLHHGSRNTKQLTLYFQFGANAYRVVLIPAVGDSLVISYETIFYQGPGFNRPWNLQIASGVKESALASVAPNQKVAQHILKAVSNWVVYHFHDTSDDAPSKKVRPLDDNRTLRPDASNIAPFLYWIKQAHETNYRQIVDAIRLVAPFFDDFVLSPSSLSPNSIKLEWKQKGSDAYFDAFSLSDGTLRFICLATLLLQPSYKLPSLLLLDEPELGLHPAAITLVAEMLEAASQHSQVLLATQSVTFLNQFSPETIVVADNDGSRSSFKRLEVEDLASWQEDYSIGDLWEKNVIGGRP